MLCQAPDFIHTAVSMYSIHNDTYGIVLQSKDTEQMVFTVAQETLWIQRFADNESSVIVETYDAVTLDRVEYSEIDDVVCALAPKCRYNISILRYIAEWKCCNDTFWRQCTPRA